MSYITVTEYAKEYNITPQYVRKLIKNKKVQAIKVHDRLWLVYSPDTTSETIDERLADAEILRKAKKL